MRHWFGSIRFWIAVAILLVIGIIATDDRIIVRHYTWQAPHDSPATETLSIAIITDLHSCFYGDNQSQIIDILTSRHIDAIVLGGDIYDDVLPQTHADVLLSQLSAITPNVYYVNGNHELYLPHDAYQQLEQKIRQYGIHILHGQGQAISADSPVMIWGVSDPVSGRFAQDLRTVGQLAKAQKPNILISHRPEHITDYTRYPFDIVISGHAHGGQWRLPYLINGLFAPNQGILPKYAGGSYQLPNPSSHSQQTQLIVSRGLARESTRYIPRIFNRPEVVFLTINPQSGRL